ncbi:MAG: hypothetical protein KAI38_06910, partial [Candidatus Latescibacteria bacterium]|nr:hypothetical protein [Candidatus Latescibacterota bacterium]
MPQSRKESGKGKGKGKEKPSSTCLFSLPLPVFLLRFLCAFAVTHELLDPEGIQTRILHVKPQRNPLLRETADV